MKALLYTTVSRHASVAYVSVQIGHPANFTRDRAESTYNEVCQESQRLLSEDCVTLIRLSLFVYSNDVSVWNVYSLFHDKLKLYKALIGQDKLKVSVIFISRQRPPVQSLFVHKLAAYRLGIDVCYAEPS